VDISCESAYKRKRKGTKKVKGRQVSDPQDEENKEQQKNFEKK